MKPEYDFKEAARGKFYRAGATLEVPVYLEPEVLAFLSAAAEKKDVAIDRIVNDLLKRDLGD